MSRSDFSNIENSSYTLPDPVALLQQLIRFDTTNPPGNEADCITFIDHLLAQAGIETRILAKSAQRPNLIARLPGQGNAAPLLLYGHVDVVTTQHQNWQYPPFGGKLVDGTIWGRGALDMKGGIAMMLVAFLRAKIEHLPLPGDVLLTIVSDEEAGGNFGARFLVEEHADQFRGIRHALGELGGYTLSLGNHRFYPIQIAEKQFCWLKVTFRGPGGHASLPVRGGSMAKLAHFLQHLDGCYLPVHITEPARLMFSTMASAIGGPEGKVWTRLLDPDLTDSQLELLGEQRRLFAPLLHHTVSPTILHGSSKINVIPSQVAVELDGRMLPGFGPDDLIGELRKLAGEEAEFEVILYDPGAGEVDMGLFDILSGILRDADPSGIPIPMLTSVVTDGRFFARLGIQTYGYLPMPLPEDLNFAQTIHAADERIPVEALKFGADAIYQVLTRFGG